MSAEAGNPKGKKPPRVRLPKGKGAERLRRSLLLSPENDPRLTVSASLEGTDLSTLPNAILDEARRDVVVSLPGAPAGEGRAPSRRMTPTGAHGVAGELWREKRPGAIAARRA